MSEYLFGLGPGWLGKEAARAAVKHGAMLVNYTDPQCSCGYGCQPFECKRSRRHWFSAPNMGEPIDSQLAEEVMAEI